MGKHTETYYGLQIINGKVTADNGETFIKPYPDMAEGEFNNLVLDIECWLESDLSEEEIEDLKELLI